MRRPEPLVLAGAHATLQPLAAEHVEDLARAARDPQVWRWLSAAPQCSVEAMTALVRAAVADPDRVSWAVVVDGVAVGSTSYLDIDLAVGALEIGWTWYDRQVWATRVNPQCKLLLLSHAFDDLGAGRVSLKIDSLNTRSRRAVLRLGATYDGTLRHHRVRPDGTVRDSAYFSVLADEWPGVRDGLLARLEGA